MGDNEEQNQPAAAESKPVETKPAESKPVESKPAQAKGPDERRPPREGGPGREMRQGGPPQGRGGEARGPRGDRPPDRGERRDDRRDDRRGPDRGRPEGPPEVELEKLISDSLYLDNQAHAVVSRMRDMDSGTKSQLRRFYNAVRRATRAPESERQHEFVMLRARLAYTIARHGLRSLDTMEKLLLQVTRRNDARGYERFRDLFEAIVAYNE
jgi:CRISPR type III-A-associated protein Csm2